MTAMKPAARFAPPTSGARVPVAPPRADRASAPVHVALPPPVSISPEAGAILLRLARAVVVATASREIRAADLSSLLPPDPPAVLLAPAGAFVTLHEDGELRGCMGSLAPNQPLWQTVISAAIGAAARDPRFLPVAREEIPSLAIDVSVLGPPVLLRVPSDFRPGIDGVVVERDGRLGLLLPEVAVDQGWGVEAMLEATCWKAGLPPGAWRDPRTSVMVFRTARVGEQDDVPVGGLGI